MGKWVELVKRSSRAIACVVRDHSGALLDCFGKPVSVSSVFMAEALAIREACTFWLKVGVLNVVIYRE